MPAKTVTRRGARKVASNRGRKRLATGLALTRNVTLDDEAWAGAQVVSRFYTGKVNGVSDLLRAIGRHATVTPEGALVLPPCAVVEPAGVEVADAATS